MTTSGAFCPSCGASVDPTADRGHPVGPETGDHEPQLCADCYFERFDLVDAPDRIELQVCASCGAVKRGERWADVGASDYTDIAVDAVTEALGVHVAADDVRWGVDPEHVDQTTIRMHATFSGIVKDTTVEESVTVPVHIGRGTCTRCGRIAGDYYASTVQVRATDRTPSATELDRAADIASDLVERMTETGDRNAFVTEISDVDDGLDIKVSTASIGRKIATKLVEEFGGHFDASETLVTEDGDGNAVYRVSFAVRLPRFTPGEIIDPADGEGPFLVESVTGAIKGRRLATGDHYEARSDREAFADATRLGTRDDTQETTLVTVEDEHAVQVLDPETYQARTIPRPHDLDPSADTVTVLKHRNGLHVLPDD